MLVPDDGYWSGACAGAHAGKPDGYTHSSCQMTGCRCYCHLPPPSKVAVMEAIASIRLSAKAAT